MDDYCQNEINMYCQGKRIEVKACKGIVARELVNLLDEGWELNLQVAGHTTHYKAKSERYVKTLYRNSPIRNKAPELIGKRFMGKVKLLIELGILEAMIDKDGNIIKLHDK